MTAARTTTAGESPDTRGRREVEYTPELVLSALAKLGQTSDARTPPAPFSASEHNALAVAVAEVADWCVRPADPPTVEGHSVVGGSSLPGVARRVLSAEPADSDRRAYWRATQWCLRTMARARSEVAPRSGGVLPIVAGVAWVVGAAIVALAAVGAVWVYEQEETRRRLATIAAGTIEWQQRMALQAQSGRTLDPGPNETAARTLGQSEPDPWTRRIQSAGDAAKWVVGGLIALAVLKRSGRNG